MAEHFGESSRRAFTVRGTVARVLRRGAEREISNLSSDLNQLMDRDARALKFLIDTNTLAPGETPASGSSESTGSAGGLNRLAGQVTHRLYVHPAACFDTTVGKPPFKLQQHPNLPGKCLLLPTPPQVPPQFETVFGTAPSGTGEWLAHRLLAALANDSVDFLVSTDGDIFRKAKRLGLERRVLTVAEAVTLITDLSERPSSPFPAVEEVKAETLPPEDPIFDGIPNKGAAVLGSDEDSRQAWVIRDDHQALAGLCVAGLDRIPPPVLTGKVLRIWFFRVLAQNDGARLGELLLKALFDHAGKHRYDWVRLTVSRSREALVQLLEDFGFSRLSGHDSTEELLMAKPLHPMPDETDIPHPLSFHIRFGPTHFRLQDVDFYLVPISQDISQQLFPECETQRMLFKGKRPFGNPIRKAYVSRSQVQDVAPGSVLLFYRTGEHRGLVASGIVEETLSTETSRDAIRAMGTRTVYTAEELEEICVRPASVLLFRQALAFRPEIPLSSLVDHKLFKQVPQAIARLDGEGVSWLRRFLAGFQSAPSTTPVVQDIPLPSPAS